MVNVPTAEELKARFPEFATVVDARVTMFIEDATRSVDDTWIDTDQSPAIMNLACHMMSLEGEPSASTSGGVSNLVNGRFLKSRQVGDVKNEWAESASAGAVSASASQSGFRSTVYGSRFVKLMMLNHTGMRVV